MIEQSYEDKFNLNKNSFLTIGSIFSNCFGFLPLEKKAHTQAIFIGDSRGILYVAEYNKKQEPEVKEKTDPFQNEIFCVDILTQGNKEKIFFSYGSNIFNVNRSCKQFTKIDFDIPFKISQFKVFDNKIWTLSDHFLNEYDFNSNS